MAVRIVTLASDMQRQANRVEFVVFDIETTGLSEKHGAEIIEISAIKVKNGETVAIFDRLVGIGNAVPLHITELTGITTEMLVDQPPIETILRDFVDFTGKLPLIGHNIKSFDVRFVNYYLEQNGMGKLENEIIDTCQLARKLNTGAPDCKLQTLADFYDVPVTTAHRALADCYTNLAVYNALISETPQQGFSIPEMQPTDEEYTGETKDIIGADFAHRIYDEFVSALKLSPEKYDISKLRLTPRRPKKGKPYFAIECFGQAVIRFSGVKEVFANVSFAAEEILIDAGVPLRNDLKSGWARLEANAFSLADKSDAAVEIYESILRSNGFDCCSRYMDCSNARKCIQNDIMFAGQCRYRQKLRKGIIYYGENRNV